MSAGTGLKTQNVDTSSHKLALKMSVLISPKHCFIVCQQLQRLKSKIWLQLIHQDAKTSLQKKLMKNTQQTAFVKLQT